VLPPSHSVQHLQNIFLNFRIDCQLPKLLFSLRTQPSDAGEGAVGQIVQDDLTEGFQESFHRRPKLVHDVVNQHRVGQVAGICIERYVGVEEGPVGDGQVGGVQSKADLHEGKCLLKVR
jgi:hypothetical protein